MIDINKVIYGLEFTKAMITFNPLTGEDIEPEDLNEDNKITYDACVGAITLLKGQEAVPVKEDKINKCKCGETVNRYWHPKFCGFCGRELLWY